LSPRTLGRGLGSVLRRVPGSVVLSLAFLGLVAVCVLFSSVLVPGALNQHVALGVTPAAPPASRAPPPVVVGAAHFAV